MSERSELVILNVDDSKDDREIIRRILEHKGYSFMQAASFEECKKVMEKRIPHLILLDIEIGKDSGLELLTYIKNDKTYKDIPVLMISNHASSELVTEALIRGAADYIIKPVTSIVLIDRIEKKLAPMMKTRGLSYSLPLDSEDAKCLVRFETHVSKISEYGVFLVSNVYFRGALKATLTSDVLAEINMNTIPKRIIRTNVCDDKTKNRFGIQKYETYLTYVGLSEEDSRNIRKYVTMRLTSDGKR